MHAPNDTSVWFEMPDDAEEDDEMVAMLWQWLGETADGYELPRVIRMRKADGTTFAEYVLKEPSL